MGFYGSNDPTKSVKALKEAIVLRTGFNPTRSISSCYKATHAYNIQWYCDFDMRRLRRTLTYLLTIHKWI